MGVAVLRDALDRGAAGIAEPEQLGGLVERLARGIVDRGGEAAIIADALDQQQLAMAARHEQQQIGKAEAGFDEPRRQRMPLKMIDRDQRLVRGVGERLAGDQPDHHPADQPGTGGRGDGIDVGERHAGIGEHPGDDRGEAVDMRARGDFGDDPAKGAMLGLLPRDAVRQNAPIAVDKRRRGFVAARFKAEDESHNRAHPLPAPLSAGQAALAATR